MSVLVQWISLQLSMQYCSYQIIIFANFPPPSKCRLVRPAPPHHLATPLILRTYELYIFLYEMLLSWQSLVVSQLFNMFLLLDMSSCDTNVVKHLMQSVLFICSVFYAQDILDSVNAVIMVSWSIAQKRAARITLVIIWLPFAYTSMNAVDFGCDGRFTVYCVVCWRGRPKRTWRKVVQKDCQAHNLKREDAVDRGRWKKLIKIGWSGWWVGECFFWYWLTRVVPDKGP